MNEIEMRSAFTRASADATSRGRPTKLHVFEIKENDLVSLTESNLTGAYSFDVIKVSDSRIGHLQSSAFDSISSSVHELVLMDVVFLNNLDDGQQLFALVRRLTNLRGLFIISTNLRQLPADAFISNQPAAFGSQLHVVRVCNSLLTRLSAYTFSHLPQLDWIDLADNRIHELESNWLYLHANARQGSGQFKISLSGNRLTGDSISGTDLAHLQRSAVLHLESNRIRTLPQTHWQSVLQLSFELRVNLLDNALNCDCEMRWLTAEPKAPIVLQNAQCDSSILASVDQAPWTGKLYETCEPEVGPVDRLLLPNGDVHKKCCRHIRYRYRADELSGRLTDVAEEKQQFQQKQQHAEQHREQQQQLQAEQIIQLSEPKVKEAVKEEAKFKADQAKGNVWFENIQVENQPEKRLLDELVRQKEQLVKSVEERRGYRLSEVSWSKGPISVRPIAAPLRILWSEARVQPLNSRTVGEISELASRSESRPVAIETLGSGTPNGPPEPQPLSSSSERQPSTMNTGAGLPLAPTPTNNPPANQPKESETNGWSEPVEEEIGFQS